MAGVTMDDMDHTERGGGVNPLRDAQDRRLPRIPEPCALVIFGVTGDLARMDAAGWMRAGPARPPYTLVPEAYLEGARESGRRWAQLHREYDKQGG